MEQQVYEEMSSIEDTNWFFAGKRILAASVIQSLPVPGNARILDIGSGTGGMTSMLMRFGTVRGIEAHPYAVSKCRERGLDVVRGSANDLPFGNGEFDLVTLFDVLYHKNVSQEAALAECYRVLKPGGLLVVTDCAHPFAWTKHDIMVHARQRYTKLRLTRAIRKAGFQPLRASYMYMATFPLFLLQRMLTRITDRYIALSRTPSVLNTLFLAALRVESWFLRVVDLPAGSSIIVASRKL